MRNFEKYEFLISEIKGNFGIDQETKRPISCYHNCKYCLFKYSDKCQRDLIDWLYKETTERIDWRYIPVNTPIIVNKQLKRYFAKFKDGIVFYYKDGCTSWSSEHTSDIELCGTIPDLVELAEVKENDKY